MSDISNTKCDISVPFSRAARFVQVRAKSFRARTYLKQRCATKRKFEFQKDSKKYLLLTFLCVFVEN